MSQEIESGGVATVLPSPVPEPKAAGEVSEPWLKIRATKGMAALNLKETWQFRDLLWTLAGRDIKVRYKQTALGVLWVILQPLINAGIFTFILGAIADLAPEGRVGHPIKLFWYVYAGTQAWYLFANMMGRVSACLVGNAALISKVFFPRFVLPLSIIPSVLLDFVIALVLLIFYLATNLDTVVLGWPLLLFPFWIALLITLGLGIGLWAAALMVSYRDVGYVLPVATQFLMLGSAVVIPLPKMLETVGHKFGQTGVTLYMLDPIVPAIQGFRWSVFGVTSVPPWWAVLAACVEAALMLGAGAFMFKRMERQFADIV